MICQLPQFWFDNFRQRLLSSGPRQRVLTSCRKVWERVLIDQIRVAGAANGCAEIETASVLPPAVAGLPPV
jgi:hypothetical protein